MVWARALQRAEDNAELAESVPRARGNRVPHGAPYEQGQPGGGCGPQCMYECVFVYAFVLAHVRTYVCMKIPTYRISRRCGDKIDVSSSFWCNIWRFMCVLECKTGCVSA